MRTWHLSLGLSVWVLISMAGCGGGSSMTIMPQKCVSTTTIVCTQSGQVQGSLEVNSTVNPPVNLRAFRGIPFAAPPVGNLRWRPPAPPAPWQGVRSAASFGNRCPQTDFNGGVMGGEDCLTLNVYTSTPPPASPQPVMVFFHGGAWTLGSAQDVPYDPAPPLAGHGVVLVTAEYRLGLLGFYASQALTTEGSGSSGNYGLMDNIAALQWVRDNIAEFGGDPSKVTIFGQSAGSGSVQALLTSPPAQGLFARAAMESTVLPAGVLGSSVSDAYSSYAAFPGLVGCADTDLTCLRAVSASAVVLAELMPQILPIGPNIDPVVLPMDPFTKLQQQGSPVPLLIGSNPEEAIGLTPPGFIPDPNAPLTEAQYEALIHTQFDPFGTTVAATVLGFYPASAYGNDPDYAYVGAETDFYMTKDTRNLARAVSGTGRPAVWRYLFKHRYENDPTGILPPLRSFHTAELPFVFGNLGIIWYAEVPYTPTPAETTLSGQMMDYWAHFAAAGDPNDPAGGAPQWLAYDMVNENTLQIDDTPQPVTIQGYNNPQCDYFSTLP